jgi:hypothetical protein
MRGTTSWEGQQKISTIRFAERISDQAHPLRMTGSRRQPDRDIPGRVGEDHRRLFAAEQRRVGDGQRRGAGGASMYVLTVGQAGDDPGLAGYDSGAGVAFNGVGEIRRRAIRERVRVAGQARAEQRHVAVGMPSDRLRSRRDGRRRSISDAPYGGPAGTKEAAAA